MIIESGHKEFIIHEHRQQELATLYNAYMARQQAYLLSKRIFDLLMAMVAIVALLSWILPLLSLFILLDSKGPALFRQTRIGRRGRPFICYKLRTMVPNDRADISPAMEDDPRFTRIGKFLRRTNLDELPQFFNVLMGSMSLVGPRPYMIEDCKRFSMIVQDGSYRNCVKPGITGLAQVNGLHGRYTDRATIRQRYRLDELYVRHAGFFMDLRILMRTIRLFFTQQKPLCK